MESTEISMFMDVKMDIHDKRPEALKFKSWSKCLAKIEAVKCFPCFLRITFIQNIEDENANLRLSINVPGVTVSLASSRTKEHSYGIFWTQNRKKCFIYFAVESETNFRRHMKWIKKSVKNLELHRQIILETRRSSRGRLETNSIKKDFSKSNNHQHHLGPLPKIPDNERTQRASSTSGVYEEIDSRRDSRSSIASGIYEEMKPVSSSEFNAIMEEAALEPMPPLPPRKRINTSDNEWVILDRKSRSNTNPEEALGKKKKYKSVLDSLFGRPTRSATVSASSTVRNNVNFLRQWPTPNHFKNDQNYGLCYDASQPIDIPKNCNKHKTRLLSSQNKRNSFSSPDLSKIEFLENHESLNEIHASATDLSEIPNSFEAINSLNECKTESVTSLNISAQIQPNFNFSCNSSTINLVGSNVIDSQPRATLDDLSGYCAMAPIKKIEQKKSTLSSILPHNDSDKENEDKSGILNSNNDSEIYENMALPENENSISNSQSRLYENLIDTVSTTPINIKPNEKEEESYYQTPRKIVISIDEKIPSYYPNSCEITKSQKSSRSPSFTSNTLLNCNNSIEKSDNVLRHLTNTKGGRRQNLYISSPQKIIDQRLNSSTTLTSDKKNKTKGGSPLMARKISEHMYSVTHTSEDINLLCVSPQLGDLSPLHSIDFKFDDYKSDSEPTELQNRKTSRIYQKYATLSRISSLNFNHLQENNHKVIFQNNQNKVMESLRSPELLNKKISMYKQCSGDLTAIKKFASLPRFKKFDFSPLKVKINNVLQRNVQHND